MRKTLFLALGAVLLFASTVRAQDDVGSVVAAATLSEIGRAGAFQSATPGDGVRLGDTMRTDATGKMRLVFRDDSVLDVAPGSEVVIDEHVYADSSGSVFNLLKGTLRSIVSDYYEDPLASYQVETPNSVSGVRGTNFIVVWIAKTLTAEIVVITGAVEVHNKRDLKDNGVVCRAGERTLVVGDAYPTVPQRLELRDLAPYLDRVTVAANPLEINPIFDPLRSPPSDGEGPLYRQVLTGSDGAQGPLDRPIVGAPPLSGTRSTPSAILDQGIGTVELLGDLEIQF